MLVASPIYGALSAARCASCGRVTAHEVCHTCTLYRRYGWPTLIRRIGLVLAPERCPSGCPAGEGAR